MNDCDSLLTKKEVDAIMNSKPAVEGRKAIMLADAATSTKELSVQQYCAARDFILVSLTRAVGTRPGALERATLGMFKSARWDNQNCTKVMLVTSHKREADGPAPIPMDVGLVNLVDIFIRKLRPLVTEDESNDARVFLKTDGAPYQRGTIGRRISAFIVKTGVRADRLISATDFRKWLVTEMKRKQRMGLEIDEELLRRLMCHSNKTAEQWYLRESLTEQAAEASKQIAAHTQPTPQKEASHTRVTPEKWVVMEMKRKQRMALEIDEVIHERLVCLSKNTPEKGYLSESLTEQAAEASQLTAAHTQRTPQKEASHTLVTPEKEVAHTSVTPEGVPAATLAKPQLPNESDEEAVVPHQSTSSVSSEQIAVIPKVFKDDITEGLPPVRNGWWH